MDNSSSKPESAPLKQKSAAHTRVPNLIYDIVCPLLDSSEADCLLYILRRTYGFSDGDGGRKERDTISLDQFEKGIVSGNYLLDLGTGLTRNTIRKSLKSLEEKGLIETSFSCLKCLWEENKEEKSSVSISDKTRAASCPRCDASLSKSYGLSQLTPKKILYLLNNFDPQHRAWKWEKDSGRFVFEKSSANSESVTTEQQRNDLREEALRLRAALWCPDLTDKAAELAGKQLKSGKISLRRRVNNFYKPVWEFQEEYNNPPLIEYALEQTIRSDVFKNASNQRWHKYMKAVLENKKGNFTGEDTSSEHDKESVLKKNETITRELLARSAKLNGLGKTAEARVLLADILAQTKDLAPLFKEDSSLGASPKDICEYSLREAFKRGSDYFVGIKPLTDDFGELDFYPEWSWPEPDKEQG